MQMKSMKKLRKMIAIGIWNDERGESFMTTEELNTKVYEKMFAEQENFRNWLLTQTPQEVLNHAYEYITREDIVLSMEYNDLSPKQAAALMKSATPLADVFAKWESWETNYMQNIWEAVTARANELVRSENAKSRNEER